MIEISTQWAAGLVVSFALLVGYTMGSIVAHAKALDETRRALVLKAFQVDQMTAIVNRWVAYRYRPGKGLPERVIYGSPEDVVWLRTKIDGGEAP